MKNHFGVKVNDVVMALVSGTLRKFLDDRGELPDSTLVAMVPVSVHDKSDRPGRNQVSGMFSSLETHIDRSRRTVEGHRGGEFRCQATQFGDRRNAASGLDAVRRARGVRRRDAACTPAPGWPRRGRCTTWWSPTCPARRFRCTSWASEVKAMYPLGPIFHGSGLNITVMSLNGKLDVGIVSCPELLPDLWDLADDFEVALDELLAAHRLDPPEWRSARADGVMAPCGHGSHGDRE